MQDEIIKGSGNSRFLKSVSDFLTRYPAYEDFAAALIEGTLPVDFNGKNSAGIAQDGTSLNKANLLSDTVASALRTWGGTTPSTVNDALAMLPKAAKIQTGSYVGTGTYGASNPCSLTFGFTPRVVYWLYDNGGALWIDHISDQSANPQNPSLAKYAIAYISNNSWSFDDVDNYYIKASGTGLTWYYKYNDEARQFNLNNKAYIWYAFG